MSQQDPNSADGTPAPSQSPYGYPQYAPQPPQPPQPLSPADERMWGMLSYLLALLLGFLAPMIIFLVYKDRSRFVRETSREALNQQITAAIVLIVATIGIFTVASIVTIVFPVAGILMFIIWLVLYIAYGVALVVFEIIGAVRANNGVVYRVPFILRLVK